VGAEGVLKKELSRDYLGDDALRFAFSKPGFLTFKKAVGLFDLDFSLSSVFARSYGISWGAIPNVFSEDLPESLPESLLNNAEQPGPRIQNFLSWGGYPRSHCKNSSLGKGLLLTGRDSARLSEGRTHSEVRKVGFKISTRYPFECSGRSRGHDS
jgi:hypothetical protein